MGTKMKVFSKTTPKMISLLFTISLIMLAESHNHKCPNHRHQPLSMTRRFVVDDNITCDNDINTCPHTNWLGNRRSLKRGSVYYECPYGDFDMCSECFVHTFL